MTQNDPNGAAAEGMPDNKPLSSFDQDRCAQRNLTNYIQTLDLSSLRKGLAFRACHIGTVMLKAEAMSALMDRDKEADQSTAVSVALSIASDLLAMHGAEPTANLPAIPEGREREIAFAYMQWLHMEKRLLSAQLWPSLNGAEDAIPSGTEAQAFHFPADKAWHELPMPSTRAELVMRFVGVDLNGRAAA